MPAIVAERRSRVTDDDGYVDLRGNHLSHLAARLGLALAARLTSDVRP